MENVPLKEARKSLGRYHAKVATGGHHIRITRHNHDAAVLIPESDYEEYAELRRKKIEEEVIAEARRISPILRRGEIPEGYEVMTRDQLESGGWLA